MTRLRTVLVLSLLTGSFCSVVAAPTPPICQVLTTARMDEYRLSSGARGLISIQARCPETGRYVLHLESAGQQLTGSQATLHLGPVAGPGEAASVTIQGLPLEGAFSGTRHLDLTLWALPGQWQLGSGLYQIDLSVRAESLDAGALP